MASQSDYRVTATLGGIKADILHLDLDEQLSQLFTLSLDVVEPIYASPSLSETPLIDREADIILWDGTEIKRHLHGVIDSVIEADSGPRYRSYTIRIRPALQRLEHVANCRVFQLKRVDEIITEILQQHGIIHFEFDLDSPKETREYCVQYNETDLHFISRLAAEEGLIFWFIHTKDNHKLYIVDRISKIERLPGSYEVRDNSANKNEASVWSFRYQEQRVTARSAERDYTFKNPRYSLDHKYEGLNLGVQQTHYEHYDYHGRYKRDAQGKPFVQYRQEHRQSAQHIATIQNDHLHFSTGQGIELKGVSEQHDHVWVSIANHLSIYQPQALKEDAVDHTGAQESQPKTTLTTTCIPWNQPWRAEPFEKPVVDGPQMAHVVGPVGEEIFCDEFGRVRIQFPWDRYGKSDEYSSCWIRVAQGWAGNQYGSIAIPRIGHEVIVDFLEGDPDQPIVMGRTYHQDNMPPYKLPANKTRMSIKSKTHKGEGYNELRFEDAKDKEQVYIHAQKDQDLIIENDRREHIRHDRDLRVDNDRTEDIGNDSHSKVERDRNEATGRKYSLTVGEEHAHQVGTHYHLSAGDTECFKAGKHIVLESGQELTLQSSGGFIKIDSSGITIQGKAVNINQGGSPSIGTPVQANIATAARLATDKGVQAVKTSEAPVNSPVDTTRAATPGMAPRSPQPLVDKLKNAAQHNRASVVLESAQKDEDAERESWLQKTRHLEIDRRHHAYRLETIVCGGGEPLCSIDVVAEGLLRHPAPGTSGLAPVKTGDETHIKDFGTVVHKVDEDGLGVWNITKDDHTLHSGWVHRRIVSEGDVIKIVTYGEGEGNLAWINENMDWMVWGNPDNKIWTYIHYPNYHPSSRQK